MTRNLKTKLKDVELESGIKLLEDKDIIEM